MKIDGEAIENNEDLYDQAYERNSTHLNNYANRNYKTYKEKVEGIYGGEWYIMVISLIAFIVSIFAFCLSLINFITKLKK